MRHPGILLAAAALSLAACAGAEPGSDTTSNPPPGESTTSSMPPSTATTSTTAATSTTTTEPTAASSCADQPIAQPAETALTFYAVCDGGAPYPIYRPGSNQPSLPESIASLLDGTIPEEREIGLHSTFDGIEEAADIEPTVTVEDGVAQIDFRIGGERWDPGARASTSAQLSGMLDPLLATVFLHEQVDALDMTTLCWGESACDGITTRVTWEGMLFTNQGIVFADNCTPELAWWAPERCTVDGVVAAGGVVPATVVDVAADDVLNLRAGPGADYFTHGALEPGATVSAASAAEIAEDGGVWRLILAGEAGAGGAAGWANQAFLAIEATAEEETIESFVAFAREPSDERFAALPLADDVGLGLGPEIVTSVPAATLRQPATWMLEVEFFRAYVGPFSAFDALSRLQLYEVSVGDHPHCVSPPMEAPDGLEDLIRISVQPRLGLESSCLQWFTVDFFVNDADGVEAITLDLWEP